MNSCAPLLFVPLVSSNAKLSRRPLVLAPHKCWCVDCIHGEPKTAYSSSDVSIGFKIPVHVLLDDRSFPWHMLIQHAVTTLCRYPSFHYNFDCRQNLGHISLEFINCIQSWTWTWKAWPGLIKDMKSAFTKAWWCQLSWWSHHVQHTDMPLMADLCPAPDFERASEMLPEIANQESLKTS